MTCQPAYLLTRRGSTDVRCGSSSTSETQRVYSNGWFRMTSPGTTLHRTFPRTRAPPVVLHASERDPARSHVYSRLNPAYTPADASPAQLLKRGHPRKHPPASPAKHSRGRPPETTKSGGIGHPCSAAPALPVPAEQHLGCLPCPAFETRLPQEASSSSASSSGTTYEIRQNFRHAPFGL